MIEINHEHRIEPALDEEPALLYKPLRPGKCCRFTFDGLSLDPGRKPWRTPACQPARFVLSAV